MDVGIFIAYGNAWSLQFCLPADTLDNNDVETLKAWLDGQQNAGTPFSVWTVLATPIVTLSDPVPLSAVPGVTNVYSDSAVAPYIEVITDDTTVGHIGATNA